MKTYSIFLFFLIGISFCSCNKWSSLNEQDINPKDAISIKQSILFALQYYNKHSIAEDDISFYAPLVKLVVDVKIDKGYYNQTKQIAIVFVTLDEIIDTTKLYLGIAAIAYWDSTHSNVKVYPLSEMRSLSPNRDNSLRDVKFYYKNKLSTSCEIYPYFYDANVGDTDFWEKCLYFRKMQGGLYYFQMYYKRSNLGGEDGFCPLKYPGTL